MRYIDPDPFMITRNCFDTRRSRVFPQLSFSLHFASLPRASASVKEHAPCPQVGGSLSRFTDFMLSDSKSGTNLTMFQQCVNLNMHTSL